MTHCRTNAPRRSAVAAIAPMASVLGALLLAGCSSNHIGEDWQCPLAAGGSCDSVAAADPAVPDARKTGKPVVPEPLWLPSRERRAGEENAPPAREPVLPARGPGQAPAFREPGQASLDARSCEVECDGFDPFGWLAGLFGVEGPGTRPPEGVGPATPRTSTEGRTPQVSAVSAADAASPSPAPADTNAAAAEPETAALPAEAAPADAGPDGADLRTGEVVARIWIAPFVDAAGIYREASHVRVVLQPAGWRLR